jgi:hypothetical protein
MAVQVDEDPCLRAFYLLCNELLTIQVASGIAEGRRRAGSVHADRLQSLGK